MGFFNFFKPKPKQDDPSAMWSRQDKVDLVLDIEQNAVNKLFIGEIREFISKFGKPDNENPFTENTFAYYQHGLIIDCDQDNKIGYIAVILNNIDTPNFSKANVTIKYQNQSFLVNENSDREVFIKTLGLEIEDTDIDDMEIVDRLINKDFIVELESTLDNKLKRISLF